jgi:hypothetical protein
VSEAAIQRAILVALTAIGAYAFRVQSGRVKVRGGYMQLAPPGTPDVLVIVPPHGRLLGLEVKTATGKEREAQVEWAEGARRLGAAVRTVRTPEEAVVAYLEAKGSGE